MQNVPRTGRNQSECQSETNWLRKNTKAGETIRLVNVLTRDFVKSLVLIAPETGMITSQSQCGNQKNASYYGIFLFKLTTKLNTTDQTS